MERIGVKARPHSFRRAFGTHGEEALDLIDPEIALILHHLGAAQSVTRRHYARTERCHPKFFILNKWVNLVELCKEAQNPNRAGGAVDVVTLLPHPEAQFKVEIAREVPPRTHPTPVVTTAPPMPVPSAAAAPVAATPPPTGTLASVQQKPEARLVKRGSFAVPGYKRSR
jgi:hypothetical protein